MSGHTTRLNLPYPGLADGPDGANVPYWIQALAEALDSAALDDQGILANRPTAGIKGRYYMVKGDSTAVNNGILWRDNGTTWDQVGSGTIVDTRANRPAASAVPAGTRFFATNQIAEWISDGSAWTRLGAQAGEGGFSLLSTASPGKILMQGQAWPATTGIYADLYAYLGGGGGAFASVLPDFRTFVPVGWKSGDTSFGTLLGTIGAKTHALITAELAVHAHPDDFTLPDHVHPAGGLAGTIAEPAYLQSGPDTGVGPRSGGFGDHPQDPTVTITGNTANPSTHPPIDGAVGNAGSGDAHNNIQPSKVVNFEVKL